MTQPDLFDSRLVALRHADGQAEQIERVSDRIAGAVIEFFDLHSGQRFHAERLREYVEGRVGRTAPGSADRIMRLCKQRGEINYVVESRSESLYRVLP